MQYEIRALSAGNTIVAVTIDAHDELDARRQAELRSLQPLSVRAAGASWRLKHIGKKRFSLLLFSQELLALVKAGLSLFEAIEALREKESTPEVCGILDRLLTALREGRRFSAALAEQSGYFTPLYIGLMQAAEGTSDLPRSLERFIEYQKRINIVRTKIVSASIYPLILICVGGVVTGFLICYVVPKFAMVYRDTGAELPWLSGVMLAWGALAANHPLSFLAAAAACVIAIATLFHRALHDGGATRLISRLPAIGRNVQLYELSRLYITLGMLLHGGTPITNALSIASATVPSPVRVKLLTVEAQVRSGRPLSTAFEANGLTTTISLRLLRVGEKSGQLGAMLAQAADFYESDVSRFVDRFTRSFEPLLMTAIGLIVGLIVVLLYLPIFDLAGSLQ